MEEYRDDRGRGWNGAGPHGGDQPRYCGDRRRGRGIHDDDDDDDDNDGSDAKEGEGSRWSADEGPQYDDDTSLFSSLIPSPSVGRRSSEEESEYYEHEHEYDDGVYYYFCA